LRLRRESVKRPVERVRHEPPPEFANVGFQLLETPTQNKGYAITNVDSLGVIERFTFGEIMRETAQWAQLLREKGLQPGDRVVIVTGREWGWRCALLGAIRAGGVAVPCPASLPLREIGAVAAHSGASLLVALRPRPDLVELDGHVALTADDLDDVDPSRALQQPPHRTEARDIALILYAWRGLDLSGTMHTHASLLAQADAGEHWLGIGADERIWATADDGSGPSIWLLLAGWRRAASIVVVDLELDSDAKLELLDRLRPAAVWFSDDEYGLLGSAEVPPWVDLGSIRRALVDTDETEGAAAFSAAFGAALVPVFTLDELGVVAGWPNGRESAADAKTAQPAPGVQLAVVGEDGSELPPGEIGDVVVRADAPALFTGYAGREGRSRSAEWFRFGWRGTLTAEGALRLEARAPSEVVAADASADIPAPEVAEASPPKEPVAVQEDEVEDGRVEDPASEQAKREAAPAEAHAAEEGLRAEQAAMALAAAEAEERRRAEEAERVEATRRMDEEKRREEERQREEQAASARADQEAKERERAEAEERRRAKAAERVEATRRMEEEKRREEERQREEKAARARANQEVEQREKAEADERRRAEEDAKTQAKIAAAEAKQRARDEKERERREAEDAKEQAKIDAAEAKQRAKDQQEREKREAVERAEREKAAAEAAKAQAMVDAAEAKQRAKDEKEREKREAVERKEREKAAAEAAKVQAKVDAAEAKQRAKDEKQREKREAVERAERAKAAAEAAKAQKKQAEVEAKQRAEEDKRRAKEREREEKEARRRADQEAKEAARAERKPAFGRRRQEVVEEPETEPEHVPDVVARIQQYGMAAASVERPAEPPEQSEDE
jgi:acyl-coenzyme A synthetase/AMP-(fatty) acid ligase